MTTTLDIINDAVKIGLGALVGGGFSILVATISSSKRREEEMLKDRRERLYQISQEFIEIESRAALFLTEANLFQNKLPAALRNKIPEESYERVEIALANLNKKAESDRLDDTIRLRSMAMGLEVIGASDAAGELRKFLKCVEKGLEGSMDGGDSGVEQSQAELANAVVTAIEDAYTAKK